ncbi:MAG TPA: transglutaminase-like domain-containing protein [Ohtaekwangia sp.]
MRILFSLCAILFTVHSYAQVKNANPERAKSIKVNHKEAKIASVKNSSSYTYTIADDNLVVLNENTKDLISLTGNLDHAEHVFYNDNITVVSTETRYTNGKSVRPANSCGNYEVEDIFYSDARVCFYRFNFLYEGTEMTFQSKLRYKDPRYLTRVFFHDDEPSVEREIIFTIPEQADVELVEQNFEGYSIKKSVVKSDGKNVYTFKVSNLTELKAEENSRGALYHYPHLVILTRKYRSTAGEKTILSSPDDLYNWCSSLVKQVNNDPTPFKPLVEKLVADKKTPEDKIRAIYYWVQDNIKYIAFEDGIAGFRPEAAQNVFTNQYGDCKGMANLTKEMLKVAGFDARLTWIGTNRIPYSYNLPSLGVNNHMICTVTSGGKEYILDATEKYIALGKNGERIQGKEMMVENGETYLLKKVPVSDYNSNLIWRKETLSLDGNSLSGEGELTMQGEALKNVFYLSTNVKQEDQGKVYDRLAVSDYTNSDKVKVTNTPPVDREKPLELKYTFSLSNKVSGFGDDLYVDMDWNKPFQNLIMEDTRVSDYYFNRKVKQKTSKKLTLPAQYKVSHLPKGISKKFPDFSIEVSYEVVGNTIVYNNEITVNNGLIRKQNFTEWNACIKELKEIYNDQLVLTKTP